MPLCKKFRSIGNFEVKIVTLIEISIIMSQNTPTNEKKGGNKAVLAILIVMIIILSGAAGFLVWKYMDTLKHYDGLKVEKIELDSTVSKQNQELEDMKLELQKMEGAIPASVADSLNKVIADLQNQVANAPTRVVYSGGGGGNKKEIESLKEEIAAWQSKYDKLLSEMTTLKSEKDKLANDVNTLTQENENLNNKTKGLEDKVNLASELKFYETLLTGYKLDKKGKKSMEEKAKKVMGFEVSFKILENVVADEGERMSYIVITGPNKKVLAESTANVFQVGGVDKVFSIQKSFYFNNKPALITADYKAKEELKSGEYTAEIYVDGKLCATSVTYLKK